MGFAVPIALSLSLLLGLVLALHALAPRPRSRIVPSLLAWRALGLAAPAEARPWRRPPAGPLLFLQLLALAALVLALARPWLRADVAVAEHIILLVDRSITMASLEQGRSRLELAREAATLRSEAAAGAAVTLIAFDQGAELLLSGETDPVRVARALSELRLQPLPGRADEALSLAANLAADLPGARPILFSDGRFGLREAPPSLPPIEFVSIGQADDNQAITALDIRLGEAGPTLFGQAGNASLSAARRRLEIWADGRLFDVREITLPPGARLDFDLALPEEVEWVEARLEEADALAIDDRARAWAPRPAATRIWLLSAGNGYLEKALELLPDLAGWRLLSPESEAGAVEAMLRAGGIPAAELPDLILLDGRSLPPDLAREAPAAALIAISPPEAVEPDGPYSMRPVGWLESPRPRLVSPDHPLVAGLALDSLIIRGARALELGPAWTPLLVAEVAGQSWPLMAEGRMAGRPAIVLAFDIRDSDLPLRPALPLWLAAARARLAPAADSPPIRLDRSEGPLGFVGEIGAGPVLDLAGGQALSIRPRPLPEGLVLAVGLGAGAPAAVSSDHSDNRGIATPPAYGRREIWPWLAALALALLMFEWAWEHRARPDGANRARFGIAMGSSLARLRNLRSGRSR